MAAVKQGNAATSSRFPVFLSEIPVAVIGGSTYTDFVNNMQLDLSSQYLYAPGITKESIAPQMEFMGAPKDEAEKIHTAFQKDIGKLIGEINKKKRDEDGLLELVKQFKSYGSRLTRAWSSVGFKGRDDAFANLHLTLQLMKLKLKDKCDDMLRSLTGAKEKMSDFLIKEPWETKVDSLEKAQFEPKAGTTAAEMGTFLVACQSGEKDTPSFFIYYSVLCCGTGQEALDRLSKWFKNGADIYEFRMIFDEPTEDTVDEVWKRCGELAKNLKNVQMQLFTLKGTCNVADDKYRGSSKISTRFLQSLAESQELQDLQRLCFLDCYVDFETFNSLAFITGASAITSVKLANLQLGLDHKDPPHCMSATPHEGGCDCKASCMSAYAEFCCCAPCCFCCYCNQPDALATKKQFDDAMKKFNEANTKSTATEALCKTFLNMVKKGRSVDVIELSGTNIPSLCGTAVNVNKLLDAMSHTRPSAVVLLGSGLTDVHSAGVCKLFFNNNKLLHLDVTLTCSDLTGLENIQSLVQNSPLLLSGTVEQGQPLHVSIASPLQETEGESNLCCSHTYKTLSVRQTVEEHQFPEKVINETDFKEFQAAIDKSVDDHVLVPLNKVLAVIWKDEPKKLKNLIRASKEEKYEQVLSDEVDDRKWALMQEFMKMVGQEAVDLSKLNLETQELSEQLQMLGDSNMQALTDES